MSDLQKGTTFTTGVSATASDLNNLVDNATINSAAITGKGAVTPDVADSLLIYDTSGSALAKCTVQNLIDVWPTDAAAGSKSLRTLGTSATQATAGNDTRLPASVTGLRKGAGAGSTDTAASPKDLYFPPVNINGLSTIDFDAADIFYDTALTGNKTYTLTNVRAGLVKVLQINQNGHTVAFAGNWLVLGTPNVASWNVYSIVWAVGTGMIVCSS